MIATAEHITRAPLARRNLGLEYLRFALAFAVLAYHYAYYGPHVGAIPGVLARSDTFNFGRFGVAAFFVISGFVIAQSSEGKSWQAFVASRLSRLWPAMAICATLTLAMAAASHPAKAIDLWRYAVAAPLVPLAAVDGNYLEPAYWSITVELRFYALVLLLLVVSRLDLLPAALIVLGTVGFVLYAAGVGDGVAPLILFPYIGFFGLGVVFHRFLVAGRTLSIALQGAIHLGFAVWGTQIWITRQHMPQESVPPLWQCALIVAGCAGLVFTAHVFGRHLTVAPFALLAGGMSYPLYLLHQRFGFDLIRLVTDLASPEMARLVTVAAVLVLAAAIHRAVERPLARPLRQTIRRRLGGQPA